MAHARRSGFICSLEPVSFRLTGFKSIYSFKLLEENHIPGSISRLISSEMRKTVYRFGKIWTHRICDESKKGEQSSQEGLVAEFDEEFPVKTALMIRTAAWGASVFSLRERDEKLQ
ncbi:MAG TPA: hypothetical protein DF613_16565 [Lachnospiraceae bacterium]|nr:hypothetical protein [Lachnospiraceae bacterium]